MKDQLTIPQATSKLPGGLFELLLKEGLARTVKKGTLLIAPGAPNLDLFFLSSGLARIFIEKSGKEITEMIFDSSDVVFILDTYFTGEPSKRGVQLLEDGQVWQFSIVKWERLCHEHPPLQRLFAQSISRMAMQFQSRADQLFFSTSLERYEQLMQVHPDWFKRLPLGIIASYLGMTQETLSRMRAQSRPTISKKTMHGHTL